LIGEDRGRNGGVGGGVGASPVNPRCDG
jgi:hypothetical protein